MPRLPPIVVAIIILIALSSVAVASPPASPRAPPYNATFTRSAFLGLPSSTRGGLDFAVAEKALRAIERIWEAVSIQKLEC